MNDLKNALRPLNSAMMVGQTSTVKVLHEMRKRGHIDHAMLFWLWKNNQCKNNGQFS